MTFKTYITPGYLRYVSVTISPEEIQVLCAGVPGFSVQIHEYIYEFDQQEGYLLTGSCSDPDLEEGDIEDEKQEACAKLLGEVAHEIAYCSGYFDPEPVPTEMHFQVRDVLLAFRRAA